MLAVTAAGALLPAQASPGDPVDPRAEARNFAKTQERASDYLTPEGVAGAGRGGRGVLRRRARRAGRRTRDGCSSPTCAGRRPRAAAATRASTTGTRAGYGISKPVHFVARNGSTLAGHVWATEAGPEKRPLVVITNGSVQASEELYWWAAQTLAKAGYAVLTWEPQGQGRSDTFGEGDDTMDGVPSQSTGNTFYDHTQDALDFALSRPGSPYCPRKSRSGTSHCDKQKARVADGLATDAQPVLATGRQDADRAGRPLVRRQRGQLGRPEGPPGRRRRGLGQPLRPAGRRPAPRAPARPGACPARSARSPRGCRRSASARTTG